MARPTKHYSREIALMLLMEPGQRLLFKTKHPKGLAAKFYEHLKNDCFKAEEYSLSIGNATVIVTRLSGLINVAPEIYKAYGL